MRSSSNPFQRRLTRSVAALIAAAAVLSMPLAPSVQAAPVVVRSVDLDTVQISFRERGAGRPVLFVHALLLDSRLWLDQLNGVCDQRRCLAPDFSGHGGSSPLTATKVDSRRYAAELLSRFVSAVHLAFFLSSPSGPLLYQISDLRRKKWRHACSN